MKNIIRISLIKKIIKDTNDNDKTMVKLRIFFLIVVENRLRQTQNVRSNYPILVE